MYLYHNNKLPKLFNQYFNPVNSVHNYTTRNASHKNYQLPVHAIHSNTAKKHCLLVVHKFETAYTQNGRISLTTD